MNTETVQTIYGVLGPLLLALLVYLGAQVQTWLSQHVAAITDARIRDAALTAAQAVKHALASDTLLSVQHENAIIGAAHELLPSVPLTLLTPAVQAAMHTVNEATKQVVAQQTSAAAATPTVITPEIDYQRVLNGLLQAILPQPPPPQPPPTPPAGPAPIPLQPLPTTSTGGAGIVVPIGTSSVPGGVTVTATGTPT